MGRQLNIFPPVTELSSSFSKYNLFTGDIDALRT